MRRLCLAALIFAGCSCDADGRDQPAPDGGASAIDAATDGGAPGAVCSAASQLDVEQDGDALAIWREEASAAWTSLGVREVFRLRFATHHDPLPRAVDDEFTFVTVIDVVPSLLLRLSGQPLQIDQTIEAEPVDGATSHEDDARVAVTSGAGHAYAIVRVLVERQAFGVRNAAARYRVQGELSLRLTRSRRALGTVALRLTGAVPFGFEDETELRVEGCFDLDATRPLACVPGLPCAVDCVDEQEWVCSDCGQLVFTHDCGCRPDLPPIAGCEDGAPAGAGQPCGDQWWCDRPCADGLSCTPDPTYNRPADAEDGGADAECHYRTCQPP